MPRTPTGVMVLVAALAGLAAFMRLLTQAMDTQSYNTWGALFLVPVVVAVDAVVLNVVVRAQPDRGVRRLIMLGFVAKLVGIMGRYLVTYVVYSGQADAERYNLYAATQYFEWRKGNVVWEASDKPGTQALELITTAIYTVIGPSTLAAFFVFGSLAFWGLYLMFRAFQVALPGADHRRYAALAFLLPSLLYWPSSIGKEAWLMLCIGALAFGAAHFFHRRMPVGVAGVILGIGGTALLRPHVTVLLVAALFVAQVVRPTTQLSTSIITKLAGIFVMGVAVWILMSQSMQFLGIDDLSWQGIADAYEYRSGNTEQGGSGFVPIPLDSPIGIPAAFATVLFRPFPWEADNLQMLAQSVEGAFLIVLTALSWRRLATLPRLLRLNPYLVFALVYVIAFVIAFAGFGNFGILARQRVLMLPFFLVFLALPEPSRRHAGLSQRELARVNG